MTPSHLHDEDANLRRLREGDDAGLVAIYTHYWDKLFQSAYQILKDKSICEDLVQDVFMHLWLKRSELVIHTSLEAYLHTAIRYRVFQALRRNPGHDAILAEMEQRLHQPPNSETNIYQKELQQRINQVIEGLPEKCREIFLLSREEQLAHKEISERLSISTKTVENQITIALKRIRQALPELFSTIIFFGIFFFRGFRG